MRDSIIIIVLSTIALSSPLTHFSEISTPAAGQSKTARKTKVDVKYDKKRDLTTVRLEDLILWKNPAFFEQVTMAIAFDYPKRTIATPKSVSVVFYSATKDRTAFRNEDFVATLDGVRLDLGKMERRGNRNLNSPGGFFFDTVRTSIPYQEFLRIAQAKKLRLEVGGDTYDLSAEQLQSLANFLQLMQQEGQEFK